MADPKHPPYCRKEREISEIHTKVKRIEKVVMDGNGHGPLAITVPILGENVKTLNEKTIPDLQRGINGFLKFQENMEGQQEGKTQIRRRTRWLIGLLVGVCISLIGLLIGLIGKIP